ncbi:MAG: DUF2314 domain-containing protein [Planctomycetes bacterium]|nr:DUF2314 domain-containing protein [Planctomycetota bacterium]
MSEPRQVTGSPSASAPGRAAQVTFEVHSRGAAPPTWEAIVRRVMHENPHNPCDGPMLDETAAAILESDCLRLTFLTRADHADEFFEIDEEMLESAAGGLEAREREILADRNLIIVAHYQGPWDRRLSYYQVMVHVVDALADLADGVIFDISRETIWGGAAWRREVMEAGEFEIDAHLRIEAVAEPDGSTWVHSHGMPVFGCPDLEVRGVPAEQTELASWTISTLAQRMALGLEAREHEGFAFGSRSSLWFARGENVDSHFSGPVMRLVDREGASDLRAFLGACDQVDNTVDDIAHDDRVEAAHQSALAALPRLRQRFLARADHPECDYLVKLGFPAGDGRSEWMWVQLHTWHADGLTGCLQNHPTLVKDLHYGDVVHFAEKDVFDWIVYDGRGGEEGNFLRELIAQARQQSPAGGGGPGERRDARSRSP